jgi:hypothetical protein
VSLLHTASAAGRRHRHGRCSRIFVCVEPATTRSLRTTTHHNAFVAVPKRRRRVPRTQPPVFRVFRVRRSTEIWLAKLPCRNSASARPPTSRARRTVRVSTKPRKMALQSSPLGQGCFIFANEEPPGFRRYGPGVCPRDATQGVWPSHGVGAVLEDLGHVDVVRRK